MIPGSVALLLEGEFSSGFFSINPVGNLSATLELDRKSDREV